MEFDNWFDIVIDELKRRGYGGPIDKDAAKDSFNEGDSPADYAIDLLDNIDE